MASENSLVTVERPWLFKPGQSGNPGGRPAGLAALVKQETRDGAELVEFYLRVLRGKRQPLRYRQDVADLLAADAPPPPDRPLPCRDRLCDYLARDASGSGTLGGRDGRAAVTL